MIKSSNYRLVLRIHRLENIFETGEWYYITDFNKVGSDVHFCAQVMDSILILSNHHGHGQDCTKIDSTGTLFIKIR